jgi:hypothetical protein
MRQTTIQRTWLDMTIQSFPSLVESYKKDLGLPKLIAPEYVSPDTAVFYKRKSTGDYERIVAPCGVQGLYTAMLKGWLMVAPDKVETPFETPASSALSESDSQVDAAVAKRELANALEQREMREEIKERPYGCPVSGCRKRFNKKSGMLRHKTVMHDSKDK